MGNPTEIMGLEPSQSRRDLEHQSLKSVLASASFDRSRSLSKLLNYICNKYFDNQTDEIKEYSIAVEALGRPADFDPKKDAIVRVEMHRLRKRLREYYSDRGGADPVRIALAEKGYVPEFIVSQREVALEEVTDTPLPANNTLQLPERTALAPREPEIIEPKGDSSKMWIWIAAGLVLIGVAVFAFRSNQQTGGPTPQEGAAIPATTNPGSGIEPSETRILAGRGPGTYTDPDGQVWEGDRGFRGGDAIPGRSDVIARGFDRNLFGGLREGRFEYLIPLKPGSYQMELFFAETMFGEGNPHGGGETSRQFAIRANGKMLIAGFDILADAGGPNFADSRVFKDLQPGPDGLLRVSFEPELGRHALVNAIRIRHSPPGCINPIRIVARPQAYRDVNGISWQADRYHQGGSQISRPTAPFGFDNAYVYQGERYGTFSYSIPVPPGRYAATLYFWEYWWGKGHPGEGGVGSRRFDVYCNFKPLLTDFDILRDSGPEQAVKRTFHGLTPNSQGKLVFAFDPKFNYALLNAIEILDESK